MPAAADMAVIEQRTAADAELHRRRGPHGASQPKGIAQARERAASVGTRLSPCPGKSGRAPAIPRSASARRIVDDERPGAVGLLEQRKRGDYDRAGSGAEAKHRFAAAGPIVMIDQASALSAGEARERAEGLEHLAVDLVVLDQDAEAILDLGEHAGHRERIEFGKRAEQRRILMERG